MMVMSTLDLALVAAYEEFNVPVDGFFGDERLTQAFVATVAGRLGAMDLDAQEVMRRLINLRKQGRLPRLRRAYYGRNVSDN
jgi:hypothetical protein